MTNEQLRPLYNMIKEIAELSENASLTGSLSGGAAQTARRYNSCLRQLRAANAVPEGMFEEIPESEANFAQIGVDARLLASSIRGLVHGDDHKGKHRRQDGNMLVRLAPFVRGEDLAKMIRQKLSEGFEVDENTLVSLAPFMPGEMMSELVQATFLQSAKPKAPSEPEVVAAPEPVAEPVAEPRFTHEETREELIERLSRPDLSAHEVHELAHRISQMR